MKTYRQALNMFAAFAAAFAAFSAFGGKTVPRPVPRPALLERMVNGPDIIGIVHWGLNTYTDREWGYGDVDPKLLNPVSFDADQIVGAAKAGGIGGLVIVAKHHDGFCLWPTKTTDYNITKTPFWEQGKGNGERGRNYVKEMEQACRRAGLKFGVYVSPWDRHDADYGTDKYVEKFHAQIKELLGGGYGEIFEMWFDGANGGGGFYGGANEKRTIGKDYYRFGDVFRFVRELQPTCCIFAEDDDSDFRYPGNERGSLSDWSRATIITCGGLENKKYLNPDYHRLRNTGRADGAYFRVCEADFPLRKGWFWHERDRDTTKNAPWLLQRYVNVIGNGGIMDLGLSPDKSGRICEEDACELAKFKEMRDALFECEVTVDGEMFNVVELSEDLTNGEQVDGWKVIADGKTILAGKPIGRRRIRLLSEPIAPAKCEVVVTAHGGNPLPVTLKRYYADPALVKTILDASADGGETDTAKWMEGKTAENAKEAAGSVPAYVYGGVGNNSCRLPYESDGGWKTMFTNARLDNLAIASSEEPAYHKTTPNLIQRPYHVVRDGDTMRAELQSVDVYGRRHFVRCVWLELRQNGGDVEGRIKDAGFVYTEDYESVLGKSFFETSEVPLVGKGRGHRTDYQVRQLSMSLQSK